MRRLAALAGLAVLMSACAGGEASPTPFPTSVATEPRSTPVATAPQAQDGTGRIHFASCEEARAAGAAPLRRGDPGYRSALDRDGDGVACE